MKNIECLHRLIAELKANGISMASIADQIGVSKATLYRIMHKKKQVAKMDSHAVKGRPRKLSKRMETLVLRHIQKNPFLTTQDVIMKMGIGNQVGRMTVSRILRRAGYQSRKPNRKPFLSKHHRKQRMRETIPTYRLETGSVFG